MRDLLLSLEQRPIERNIETSRQCCTYKSITKRSVCGQQSMNSREEPLFDNEVRDPLKLTVKGLKDLGSSSDKGPKFHSL